MDLSKLNKIRQVVQEDPNLPENNRFNFGKFKGVSFDKVIYKSDFKRWFEYMILIKNEWTDGMRKDIKNFERALIDMFDDEEYEKLKTTGERLNFIFNEEEEEKILFWFGKYRNVELEKVPNDYKIWWASSLLDRHQIDDNEFWTSEEGKKSYKLLMALNLC